MNFSKWANILKIILLKIVEEIERRINEKNGVQASDGISSSIYTSLKFIVLDQVDSLVDDAVSFTKKQINDLSTILAEKTAAILASVVYIILLIGLVLLVFILFIIALSLYLGTIFGHHYIGFLISGGLMFILTGILFFTGHKSISAKIKKQLLSLIQ